MPSWILCSALLGCTVRWANVLKPDRDSPFRSTSAWTESTGRFMSSRKGTSGHVAVPLQPALASLLSISPLTAPLRQPPTANHHPTTEGSCVPDPFQCKGRSVWHQQWLSGLLDGGLEAEGHPVRGDPWPAEPQHPPSPPCQREPHQHGEMSLMFVFHTPLLPANVIKQRSFHRQPPSCPTSVLLAQAGGRGWVAEGAAGRPCAEPSRTSSPARHEPCRAANSSFATTSCSDKKFVKTFCLCASRLQN